MKIALNEKNNHCVLIEDRVIDIFAKDYSIIPVEFHEEKSFSNLYITEFGEIFEVEYGSINAEMIN